MLLLSEENLPLFFFVFSYRQWNLMFRISACKNGTFWRARASCSQLPVSSNPVILWMEEILHQLTGSLSTIHIPGGAGFLPSTVCPKTSGFLRSTTNLKWFGLRKHQWMDTGTMAGHWDDYTSTLSLSHSWPCTCFLSVYVMYATWFRTPRPWRNSEDVTGSDIRRVQTNDFLFWRNVTPLIQERLL